MSNKLIDLRNKIQEEYNNFVDQDELCELTDDEINESFWSNSIIEYNDEHKGTEVGFIITNGIIDIVEY